MMRPNRKPAGWIIALCGLWEAGDIAAVFVQGFGQLPAYLWNHILVGIFMMIAGVWLTQTRNTAMAVTMSWLATGAGAWLVIASFILRKAANTAGFWNDIIMGLVVITLGIWAAIDIKKTI